MGVTQARSAVQRTVTGADAAEVRAVGAAERQSRKPETSQTRRAKSRMVERLGSVKAEAVLSSGPDLSSEAVWRQCYADSRPLASRAVAPLGQFDSGSSAPRRRANSWLLQAVFVRF